MSSGGGKNTTTTAASGPPAWAEPYFKSMLNRANSVTSQPYVGYDGPRIADFSQDQLAGFDMVRNQAAQGSPLVDQAGQYVQNQLNGANAYTAYVNPWEGATTSVGTNQYAGPNPYLDQMIGNASRDVTENFSNVTQPNMLAQFNAGGAYGGSAMQNAMQSQQQTLARQLGDISTNLRSQDYDRQVALSEADINRRMQAQQTDLARNSSLATDHMNRNQSAWAMNRGNEQSVLGMIPQLNSSRYDDARALMNIGMQEQNLAQSLYDTGYEDFLDWRNYDNNQLGVLANALGSVQGGTSSQTGANPNYRSASQNAAGYAALIASLWG